MPLTLRAGGVADAAIINEIYNPYVFSSTCTLQLEPSTLEERRAWLAPLDPALHPVLIAEENGSAVGWGALFPFHVRTGYRTSVENSVYVREGFHGRGVGRALMTELLARARSAGHHSVIARITGDQAASIRLHQTFGFVEAGRLVEVGRKFDRWVDVLFLQLLL